jgi:dihydroorotase
MRRISVAKLIDPHVHLREGEGVIEALISHSVMGGAIVLGPMPNTLEGLKTAAQVTAYIENAKKLVPGGADVKFIPIAMLTEDTTFEMIDEWVAAGILDAKVYPLKRTTNSEYGVEAYSKILKLVDYCGKVGVRVHLHPENPNMLFGNRDAEYQFIPIMEMLIQQAPETIFVWEHATDRRCIPFFKEWAKSGRFYVTITAHHLISNEDNSYGDVRAVCKPNPKEEADRLALITLISEKNRWVMAGTDTAFHDKTAKHTLAGKCACGAFTAPNALVMYAHALDHLFGRSSSSDVFDNFVLYNASDLYGLDLFKHKNDAVLEEGEWEVPDKYKVADKVALSFMAGEKLKWKIV